ncbi:hypothetical protein Bca4012_046568 [Brassica carinata]|uniref:Uncharacterized protein n=1 Tax=Brassica carinata TaxID=52824 RepID=A0A8X7QR66_BRACI|nr:hypothetical protein Bca52824_056813 [Brassica carinata]
MLSPEMVTTLSNTGLKWYYNSVVQGLNSLFAHLFFGLALVRWFGFLMLVITLALVHSSAFVDTLSDGYKWLARSVVIAPGLLIFPFCPRPWPMKEKLEEWCVNMSEKPWFRSILYDLVKGGGAIACYYGSNYLGTFLQIITDPCLIHATVSFTFFLLTLDFLYDFEEVIELCDNFVFACYGLMINENQRKIRHFFVHATCVFLCVFKSFLRSNMQLFLSKIEKPEVGLPLTIDQATQSTQAIQSTPPSQSPPPSQSNPGDDTSGTGFHGARMLTTK